MHNGSTAIKQLLTYLNCSKIEYVTNDNIAQIHNYVRDIKLSGEVRNRFMTVGDWLDRQLAIAVEEELGEAREEGREEGRAEGALKLCIGLVKDGVLSLAEAAKRLGITEEE